MLQAGTVPHRLLFELHFQLVVLFRKVMETLGCKALLAEEHHWRQALKIYKLPYSFSGFCPYHCNFLLAAMFHHNYGLSLPQDCKPNKPFLLRVAFDKVLKHSIRKMAKTSTVWEPRWQRWDVLEINPLHPTWDQYRVTSRKHLVARKNKGWMNKASHCSSSWPFPLASIFPL